jgi:hypothetical protein
VPPVLDSLDNYNILSERMNVLTIYLPCRKLPVASNLCKVKTAVQAFDELQNIQSKDCKKKRKKSEKECTTLASRTWGLYTGILYVDNVLQYNKSTFYYMYT